MSTTEKVKTNQMLETMNMFIRSFRKDGTKVKESARLVEKTPAASLPPEVSIQTKPTEQAIAPIEVKKLTDMEITRDRIDRDVAREMAKRKATEELSKKPDLKFLIEKYKAKLTQADLDAGERGVRAKVEMLTASDNYNFVLRDEANLKVTGTVAQRMRSQLFSEPRTSTAQVFYIPSAGYWVCYDNERVFIKSDKAKHQEMFYALIKPEAGDNRAGSPNVIIGATFSGTVTEVSATEFADILKNKPSYDSLVKAYRLFNNAAVTIATANATNIL